MIRCFSDISSPVAGYVTSWLPLAGCRWRRGAEGRGGESKEEDGKEEEGVDEEGEDEEGEEEESETCRLTTTPSLSAEVGSSCSSTWPLSSSSRPKATRLALAASCHFRTWESQSSLVKWLSSWSTSCNICFLSSTSSFSRPKTAYLQAAVTCRFWS